MLQQTQPDRKTIGDGARLSGLDELRGVAIALVLALHLAQQLGGGNFLADLLLIPALGVGVDLFFVVSGVVIAHSLLGLSRRGLTRWEAASVFYTRRFMRIVPFAWFVAVLAGSSVILANGATKSDIAAALSFTGNFHWAPCFAGEAGCGNPQLTGHFWSLGTEMQFYLAAPILLLMRRTAFRYVVGALLVAGIFWDRPWGGFWWTFRLEALALGVLIGLELEAGNKLLVGKTGAMTLGEAVLWMLIAGVIVRLLQPIAPGMAIVLVAVTSAAVVGRCLKRPKGWSRTWFAQGAAWLGGISYGIYLVHPLVIAAVAFALQPDFGFGVSATVATALSLLIGWYLTRAVEKPARDLGYWLTQIGETPPRASQ